MPELPEVETVVRDLRPLVAGRTIRAVRCSSKKLRDPWLPAWNDAIVGAKMTAGTAAHHDPRPQLRVGEHQRHVRLLVDEEPHRLPARILDLEGVGLTVGRLGHARVGHGGVRRAEQGEHPALHLGAELGREPLLGLGWVLRRARRSVAHHDLHPTAHTAAVLHVGPGRFTGQHLDAFHRHAARELVLLALVHAIGALQREGQRALHLPAAHVAPERPLERQRLHGVDLRPAECLAHVGQHLRRLVRGLFGRVHRQRHHAIGARDAHAHEHRCRRRHRHPRSHRVSPCGSPVQRRRTVSRRRLPF